MLDAVMISFRSDARYPNDNDNFFPTERAQSSRILADTGLFVNAAKVKNANRRETGSRETA